MVKFMVPTTEIHTQPTEKNTAERMELSGVENIYCPLGKQNGFFCHLQLQGQSPCQMPQLGHPLLVSAAAPGCGKYLWCMFEKLLLPGRYHSGGQLILSAELRVGSPAAQHFKNHLVYWFSVKWNFASCH